MKKTSLILAGLILLALLYNLGMANGKTQSSSPNQAGTDYVIISYASPIGNKVTIHRGGDNVEEIKPKGEILNHVIDLLNKFNLEGYQLVSTTSAGASGYTSCFLKKVK